MHIPTKQSPKHKYVKNFPTNEVYKPHGKEYEPDTLRKVAVKEQCTYFRITANTMNIVWVCSISLVSYSEFATNEHKNPSVIKINDKLKIIMNAFKIPCVLYLDERQYCKIRTICHIKEIRHRATTLAYKLIYSSLFIYLCNLKIRNSGH